MGRIQRKKWRNRLGKKGNAGIRKIMAAIIFLECLYVLSQARLPLIHINSILREESIYQVEWVVPSTDSIERNSDVFGIWFDRESWQIKFYRTKIDIERDVSNP
ncbi:MAG: hypothetical protein ACRDBO_17620 [Lachnospiraceae bacterium]